MAIATPPINWQTPIVDANGVPTAAFQRLWEVLNNLANLTSNQQTGSSSVTGIVAALVFGKG